MKAVLLVEDDKAILEAIQMVLDLYGYPVICAQNGQDALKWLRSGVGPPGVVLLDLTMPVMDGSEFLEEQKRDPKLASIPIIVMSARNNLGVVVQTTAVSGCIKKPIDMDTLIETVKRYCA